MDPGPHAPPPSPGAVLLARDPMDRAPDAAAEFLGWPVALLIAGVTVVIVALAARRAARREDPLPRLSDQTFAGDIAPDAPPLLAQFCRAWHVLDRVNEAQTRLLVDRLRDVARVGLLDLDANPNAVHAAGVTQPATLVLFHRGRPVWTHAGQFAAEEIEAAVRHVLGRLEGK
ncbi:MAG: hypothetical protein HY719_11995 [Planctomycetes bacterium]|nr:hypothetical protein [Planctomycetota bacterium]